MSVEYIGSFFAEGFSLLQLGVLAATVLLVFGTLVMLIIASRTTAAARNTQNEAQALFASLETQGEELRSLTGQVERAWQDVVDRQAALSAKFEAHEGAFATRAHNAEAPAAEYAASAEAEAPLSTQQGAAPEPTNKDLAAARQAANVPSALLRGLLRRR